MKKFYILLLITTIFLFATNAFSQVHFNPSGDFTEAMSINILEAKVNGVNLVAGDEIGIFDGSVCVGAVVLTKDLQALGDLHIAASKAGADDADSPAKDGYKSGNAISFKLYDASEDEEIPLVVATFVSNTNLSVINPSPTFNKEITGYVSLTATHNYAPKARAGADQELLEGAAGALDGSLSYDFDKSPITFTWTDIDNLGISATDIDKPTFNAPLVNADKKYRLELKVNDGVKDSKPDTLVVTVKQINYPPVANAGADFEVPEGDAGELDASGSTDPDGLALTYSWVIEPADFAPVSPDAVTTGFTAPLVTNDKEYKAILTVTNTVSLSDKDTVIVKVINYNLKPLANAGTDVAPVDEGVKVTLDGSGSSDPDTAPNATLTYKWTSAQGITINNSTTVSPDFTTPFFLKDSTLQMILVVNDGGTDSKPDTVLINVKHKNLAPTANAGADQNVDEGVKVTLTGAASSDPDKLPNVTLAYKWTSVQGLTINNSTTVTPDFTTPFYLKDSTLQFVLVVNDGALDSKTDTVLIKVKHKNLAPVANAGADQEVDENVKVTLDGSASADADKLPNAAVTYKWTSAQGITMNGSTTVSPDFTTPFYLKDSTLQFVLVVNDGDADSKTDTVLVKVKHKNLAPTANAGADQNVDEGVKVTLTGAASSDPDKLPNVALAYKWTSVQGLTINNSTTVSPDFTTPFYLKDSTLQFVLVVNDGALDSKTDTVLIKVKHKNLAPTANAGADQEVDENVKVTLDGSASADADKLPNALVTYKWTSVQGLAMNGSTTVSPDFTTPFYLKDSTLQFVLVVNDGEADSKTDTVLVKVKHKNLAPTANAGADQNVDEGVKVTLTGAASSDPDKLPNVALAYKWTSVQGLTINNSTTVSPDFTTPFYLKDSTLQFVLVVNDGALDSKTDTVLIKVKHKNLAPTANAGADQEVDENVKVTLDGSASADADKLPNALVTYKWTSVQGLAMNGSTTVSPDFTTPFYLKDSTLQFVLVVNDGAADSKTDTVLVKVKHKNLAPTANAGADQNVDEGVKVTLTGAASSDPDKLPNVTLAYKWTSVQGLAINNGTTVTPDFTTPFYLKDSTLQFVLVVNDGALDSKTDTVLIKVKHKNLAPVANAGADQNVDENVKVTLDGSASADADKLPNSSVTYKWTSVQGLAMNGSTTVSPDFTTPFYLKDSTLQFVLVVNDGAADSKTDTVLVKVKHKNLAPIAKAGNDFSVNENAIGQLNGAGSKDLDGTFTYQWTATGVTITGSTLVNPTFTAPEVQADSIITFTLTVTDNKLETAVDAVDVTIKHINKKPVANAGSDQEVDENIVITLDGSKTLDPDLKDKITYKWVAPAGIVLDDENAIKPTFTSPVIVDETKDYLFKLIVNDGKIDSDTDKVVIKVIHLNIAPVADAGADITINENVNGNLNGIKSSDFEGKPLIFSWSAPAGFVISNPAIVQPSFDAPEVHKDTVFTIVLTVNDGVRNSLPDTVLVSVKHINKAPIANAGPDQTVAENVLVQLDGSASKDLDKYDVITYLWTSLDGASLDDNNSAKPTFTTPWLMADKTYRFSLIVNDGMENSVTDEVTITVKHANLKPVADAGESSIIINEGENKVIDGSGSSDPEGMSLTYLWTSVPAGLVISNQNKAETIFEAPQVEKDTDYKLILTVNDKQSSLNIASDTILVKVLQINKLPVANAGADITIREQKLVMLDGSASYDPDALDTLSFNWIAPAGIVLDDPTSPKPFFIAPDVSSDTEFSFELVITDKLKSNIKSVNIPSGDNDFVIVTVTANKAPVADAGPNQKIRINNLVTLHGEGSSDPDGDVITYVWTAPAGIILSDPTSAKPTFMSPDSDVDKSYIFTLEVTDDLGVKDSKDVTIDVISNVPPVISTETEVYVFEGEYVSLDASLSSDSDGDALIFDWFHGNSDFSSNVPLVNKSKPVVSFTAPEVETLTYMPIVLRLTDGTEDTYQTVKVYIKDIINLVPVAIAGTDFDAPENVKGYLDGTASVDVEGKPVTYLWSSEYLVLDDVTAAKPSFTAPEVVADTTVLVTLVVNDGKWNSAPDTVLVTVKQVNKIPVAVAGSDIVVNEGDQIKLDGSASSDPDGDVITYKWSAVGLSITGGNLATAVAKAPDVQKDMKAPVLLVVNDGKANSAPDTVWVTIKQLNKAPVWIEAPEDEVALAGYEYSAEIKVSDSDLLDKITITSIDLPNWLTLTDNGDGTATVQTDSIPRLESLLGTHTFVLKASDGVVNIEKTVELTVTIKTGIEDLTLNAVKFYPNPTSGLVNVEFNSFPESGTTIQVFNQLGQSVMIRKAENQINQLNLLPNPNGLYYIKVITDKAFRTEKVILR